MHALFKQIVGCSIAASIGLVSGCKNPPRVESTDQIAELVAKKEAAALAEKQRQEAEAAALAEKQRQEAEVAALAEKQRQFDLQVASLKKDLPAGVEIVSHGGPVSLAVIHKDSSVKKESPGHIKITLGGSDGFMTGQMQVNKRLAGHLKLIARSAVEYSNLVTVSAHTDSVGSDKANQALSEKRAQAVAKFLFTAGVNRFGQLVFSGYGESNPVADNKTADGRAKNRRVEIILLLPGSAELTT